MEGVDIQRLVNGTLAGDERAWQRMSQHVEPTLSATLRRPQVLGRLSQSEDDCRNIVVEVMSRLRANRFARLGQYAEARRKNSAVPFMGWLVVVAKRVAIDYMRGHEAYVDRRNDKHASSPGAWREIRTLPSDSRLPGARRAVTGRGTAHQLYAFASAELFTDEFRGVLASAGVKCLRLPTRSPDLNSVAERFVLSIKSECLSKLVPLGERHLRRAVSEYMAHCHGERNHQGVGNRLLTTGRAADAAGQQQCAGRAPRAARRTAQLLLTSRCMKSQSTLAQNEIRRDVGSERAAFLASEAST
jgi:hypothetical protein